MATDRPNSTGEFSRGPPAPLLVKVLWGAFACSIISAGFLSYKEYRKPKVRVPVTAQSQALPAPAAPRTSPEFPGDAGRPLDPCVTTDADSRRSPAEPQTDAAGGTEFPAQPKLATEEELIALEEFAQELFDLLMEEKLDEFLSHARPGFVRAMAPLLERYLTQHSGRREEIRKAIENLEVEVQERPDGALRLRILGAMPFETGEDLLIVPEGGSWKLAAESDLPGPAADRRRAMERLRLLAICQRAYFDENLGGRGPELAGTIRELREGLERSPLYEGILDPEFAAAADAGWTTGGYRYGKIEAGHGSFACSAAPAVYGPDGKETFVIDGSGAVWAKDLGGEPPPADWPADPEKAGWSRQRGPWPSF